MGATLKILLLSAYDAASHKRWRTGLVSYCPDHEWTCLSLPARYFNWRVRGNSLSWAFTERDTLEQDYDLLIATSMVDLSALRGFVPKLAGVPTLVYFHENQFDYPVSNNQKNAQHKGSVEPQILSIYSALCATALVFNSDYNRQTFLKGAAALLKKLPDAVPSHLIEQMERSSQVLPVPLDDSFYPAATTSGEIQQPLQILWNHRWEYDKGPDRLLLLIRELKRLNVVFQMHVVGQQFRQQPVEFDEIKTLLLECNALGEWGFVESELRYRQLLQQADVVLSTALHDFQGLSVLEAVASGCRPLLPARQAYPEWFGRQACYSSYLENPAKEAKYLARDIQALSQSLGDSSTGVGEFRWSYLRSHYERLFSDLSAV